MAQLQAEPRSAPPTTLACILPGCHAASMPAGRCRRLTRDLPIHPGAGATVEPASMPDGGLVAGRLSHAALGTTAGGRR
jgi:hypothetical protein